MTNPSHGVTVALVVATLLSITVNPAHKQIKRALKTLALGIVFRSTGRRSRNIFALWWIMRPASSLRRRKPREWLSSHPRRGK